MLLDSLSISRSEFESGTGWALKPQGACKADVCIPLSDPPQGPTVQVDSLAEQMGMPLVADEGEGLWALGPESSGSRTLVTAEAPELSLPDHTGQPFVLSSLRGQKVLMVAWSPY